MWFAVMLLASNGLMGSQAMYETRTSGSSDCMALALMLSVSGCSIHLEDLQRTDGGPQLAESNDCDAWTIAVSV